MNDNDGGTPFKTQCMILSELWTNYRSDSALEDFISYNDIGLPAAFLVETNLADPSPHLEELIKETFKLLIMTLGLEEDTGFEDLDQMLVDSGGPDLQL